MKLKGLSTALKNAEFMQGAICNKIDDLDPDDPMYDEKDSFYNDAYMEIDTLGNEIGRLLMKYAYHKRKAKHYYLAIMNYPASCSHSILKQLRPDLYVGFRKHWEAMQSLDSSVPDLPEWAAR